ncbi:MAG TPA: electron transfer flavoprotein subunit alpha/FixB family protein [Thermomicrobiales bacterium]
MAADGGVLIVGEATEGALRPVSLEIVSAGRQVADSLGQPLVAALLGSGIESAARELARFGVERVLVVDDPRLAAYTAGATTAVLASIARQLEPSVILIPGTTAGRDFAPRLAARLRTGLAADCVELAVEDGAVVAVRPILGGRVQTAVNLGGSRPQMATIRPGSFEKATASGSEGTVEPIPVDLSDDDLRVLVKGLVTEESNGATRLDQAPVIVAGGRGLKEPENFQLIEELAAELGAAVGASRAVVDAGWRPHHEQVGQTGQTVSPRLYIAVGISGAVQHLVGMQGSDYIVAINRDPDAPIFKIASFGIVGDLFEVVPAVIAELRAAKA